MNRMNLNLGPDIRYGVEFSDGRITHGSRRKVLIEAIAAWNKDIHVIRWIVPGALEINRKQSERKLQEDYNTALAASPD